MVMAGGFKVQRCGDQNAKDAYHNSLLGADCSVAQSKRLPQRNIIMPARQAVNRSGSMTSNAIPTVNNPAIPMPAAHAAFFLAHANEKQAKANGVSIDRCASASSFEPSIGVEG